MLKLTKDGGVKIVDPKSTLIPALLAAGWEQDGPKESTVKADRAALLAEARELGLEVHHMTGADKLAALIAEAKGK